MLRYEDIPRRFNVASYFLDRNLDEGRGDRVALHHDGGVVTYAELSRLANRVGNGLRELGVRQEERVLIALSDSPEFVATWYGAQKIGAVTAEVYTFLQPKDYAYYVDYTRARVVFVDGGTLDKLRPVAGGAQLVVVRARERLRDGELSFEELVEGMPDELEAADTTKDDIVLWKFTTGSTGMPKAAVHPAHNPLVSFHCFALGVLGFHAEDVVLPVPKLFFGYARDMAALFPFGVGASGIVFPDRSTPERVFELIERHRPTILVNVPTMMNAMVSHVDADRHDLTCVRCCVSSGEALPEELHRRWLDTFGVEVLEGVGSSELYHIYLSNRPGRVRPGSGGELVPGYRAAITDEEGNEVPDGTPGELRAAGETSALLYWNDHAKSKATFAGDWVRTGDLFVRDRDGFFWYRGRADDLLKVGGIWVAPLEIENCLLRHDSVAGCAVIGYEEAGLTLPRAYVVAHEGDGSPELARELQDFVRANLSPHKYPREVRFVDELPKTASGKVDRKALREREERAATAAPA